jgi:hypothetical protein
MRNCIATSLITLLALVGICLAEEKPPQDQARSALVRLKAQCDVPGQSDKALRLMYVSATERARREAIAQLKSLGGEIVPLVRAESLYATNEYREMLTVALAALRDDAAILATADLMLVSKRPSVRVCATLELRGVKDKRTIGHFKKALRDSYKREDGSCVRIGDGVIYPVRIIASGALVEMGVPFDEVRKLRGDLKH